eukprot:GHUV01037241.1.p1 GENE.GHUV01037241.1~~GHUV01037241.1.p1  ORF type:complete len:184 (-),score=30.73 GHUV01037241.1:231-782(-)
MTALAGYAKVALLLAVLSATAVNAQSARQGEDTTGKQIEHARGFTFGSNVAGYLRLSTDVCDIKAAIGPDNTANYEAAAKIYSDGKNSFKSDGTQRAFQGAVAGHSIWRCTASAGSNMCMHWHHSMLSSQNRPCVGTKEAGVASKQPKQPSKGGLLCLTSSAAECSSVLNTLQHLVESRPCGT